MLTENIEGAATVEVKAAPDKWGFFCQAYFQRKKKRPTYEDHTMSYHVRYERNGFLST